MTETIQDKMPITPDLNRERLEQLQAIMPDLLTNDGGLDPEELKGFVDPETVAESEGFEFRWFGKANAKRNAFTPTMASLDYDPARSVNPELANGTAIIEGENLEALELAAAESQAHGFQYICTLNSDYVPRDEFSPGFRIEDFIRLRLTDANVAGCLMGVRF